MRDFDLDPSEWTRDGSKPIGRAASVATIVFTAIFFGVGLAAIRGDLNDIPALYIVPVVLGGVAIAGAVVGVGYVTCKAWDWLWAKVKALP